MNIDLLLYASLAIIAGLVAALWLQITARREDVRRLKADADRAAAAAERSGRQMVDILEQLPIGVIAVEAGTRTLEFANDAADELLMGRQPAKLELTDADGVPLDAAANPFVGMAAPSAAVPVCMVDAKGVLRHLCIGSGTVHDERTGETEIVYVIHDRTEQVSTEKALERSHRLEALGTLTSGVAHDFNNMLTPIMGGLDLAARDAGLSDATRRALERATQATGRATTLVHRLLAFSREQELDPHPVDLRDLVDGACDLFGRKLGPDVTVFTTARTRPAVKVDAHQFELVMLNLMTNARDAMPEGGSLRIAIGDDELAEGAHGLPTGRYAHMTVTDDGEGMTEEVRRRATEPFFTTKPTGTASGMGLAMVEGFAAQSGGAIGIASAPGQGTRIDLWLPRLASIDDVGDHDPVEPPVRRTRILLVDDEEMVRGATAEMLADIGHDVVQASSGAEGVAAMRRDPSIGAIVADHLMPGMTGGAMVHEIWDFAPRIPALLVTGYAQTRALPSDMAHLAKPFRRADLARAVDAMTRPDDQAA